jgi:hypothetical protein
MVFDFPPGAAAAGAAIHPAQIISLVKKNAFTGEKGLDTISPVW